MSVAASTLYIYISCHIVVVDGYCRRSLFLVEFLTSRPWLQHTFTNVLFPIFSVAIRQSCLLDVAHFFAGRSFCPDVLLSIPYIDSSFSRPCTSLFSQVLHYHIPTKPYILTIYSNIKPYSHLGYHIIKSSSRHIVAAITIPSFQQSSLPT